MAINKYLEDEAPFSMAMTD